MSNHSWVNTRGGGQRCRCCDVRRFVVPGLGTLYTVGWCHFDYDRPPCPTTIAAADRRAQLPPSNWKAGDGGKIGAWEACPRCKPELGQIYLPRSVSSDSSAFFLETPSVATVGAYLAVFNPQGAASVRASDGKMIGMKPSEFIWLNPVPPYDRWCQGQGGLHQ